MRRLTPGGPFFLNVACRPTAAARASRTTRPTWPPRCPAPRAPKPLRGRAAAGDAGLQRGGRQRQAARIRTRPSSVPGASPAITEEYRRRLESLLAVDEGIAEIVTALRAAGELDNTLILFTSDNGFFHGEHRVQTGRCSTTSRPRVPLIVHGPGIPRGMAGATGARTSTSRRRSSPPPERPRRGRWTGGRCGVRATRGPQFRTRHPARDPELQGAPFARYVYIEHSTNEQELYDLAADPNELASLHASAAHAPLKADLAARLAKLIRTCAGGTCRRGASLGLRVRYGRGRSKGRVCARGRSPSGWPAPMSRASTPRTSTPAAADPARSPAAVPRTDSFERFLRTTSRCARSPS